MCMFVYSLDKRRFRVPGGVGRGLNSRWRTKICARELASLASRVYPVASRIKKPNIEILNLAAAAANIWILCFASYPCFNVVFQKCQTLSKYMCEYVHIYRIIITLNFVPTLKTSTSNLNHTKIPNYISQFQHSPNQQHIFYKSDIQQIGNWWSNLFFTNQTFSKSRIDDPFCGTIDFYLFEQY